MSASPIIGIAGLGHMGQAMALRLLDMGHTPFVYNRTIGKAAALKDAGARVAGSIAELAESCDFVITMLADDDALLGICAGDAGLTATMRPAAVHLVMGTHGLEAIRTLEQQHGAGVAKLVCAPVLGRPEAARQGQISVVVAGHTHAVERCAPILAALSCRTFHAGTDPAAAATMKLANNFVLGCAIEAMAEAFALVRKSGADAEAFREILVEGLFSGIAHRTYSQLVVDGNFSNPGFSARLALKDADLIAAAGAALGVPVPSGSVLRNALIALCARGCGDLDWAAVADESARASGQYANAS